MPKLFCNVIVEKFLYKEEVSELSFVFSQHDMNDGTKE